MGGVGTGKETGKSIRKLCRNYPLATYPLKSARGIPTPNPLNLIKSLNFTKSDCKSTRLCKAPGVRTVDQIHMQFTF